jgi:hypothetical protein
MDRASVSEAEGRRYPSGSKLRSLSSSCLQVAKWQGIGLQNRLFVSSILTLESNHRWIDLLIHSTIHSSVT